MKKTGWTATGKRLLSGALALLLTSSILIEPAAAVAAQQWNPLPLEAARITNMPDGEYVYFGTAATNLEEADGAYSVPIYREGDLSGEVTVEIRTNDLSALYGKDYTLLLPDLEKTGDDRTILETYMGDLDCYEAALNAENADCYLIDEDNFVDEGPVDKEPIDEGDWYVEAEGTGTSPDVSGSGKSGLAARKEAQTGEPTRELYKTEYQDLLQAAVEQLAPQTANQLDYSSTATLTFAPGEAEKQLVFRIKDDHKSEGTETFSIRLTNVQGAEIYQVATLSVSISDDEPMAHSKVSFTRGSYDSENGVVTVTVKRTGAEYSLVDMNLLSSYDTAVAGENYEEVNERLAFAPYETEKEISLDVYGEGSFSLLLTDLTACEPGRYTKATINIIPDEEESDRPAAFRILRASSSDNKAEFSITLDKEYTVEYTPGEHTGRIMDEDYTPAVEVGTYYFSTPASGGIFHYSTSQYSGDKPNKLGTLDCTYVDTGTQDTSYGDVAYYHTYNRRTGKIWAYSDVVMPGVYYQYVTPNWESTSGTYGGQAFRFHSSTLDLDAWAYGKFGKQVGNAVLTLYDDEGDGTKYNKKFHVSVNAVDNSTGKTPKSYLRFYGVACMYKQYRVSVSKPSALSFRTGTGSSVSADPIQLYLRCGVQNADLVTTDLTRDIYANPDGNQSNVVFSLNSSTVNGMIGKFANLTGYTIKITSGEEDVSLEYPRDFISFLNSRTGTTGTVSDYGSTAIQREINKVNNNLGTVPFDSYFIDWIDTKQKEVLKDSYGYHQNLTFTPHFEYIKVPVRVVGMQSGGPSAHFTDATLGSVGTYEYHAGDVLDLSAVCTSDGYRITGYEVSTDGGENWNSIRDTKFLALDPSKVGSSGYYIRPLVEKNDNCIEIKFANDTAKHFTILGANYGGLISDDLLAAERMAGSYILRLNDGSTAKEQMTPVSGQVYSIHIPAYQNGGKTYYPVIRDAYGDTYTTQTLHYTARSSAKDNVLLVDYYAVAEAALTEYTITGHLVSNYKPILPTGTQTQHLGVEGYTVSLAKGVAASSGASSTVIDAASDLTGSDGSFTLTGVTAFAGQPMTMLVSNGADGQVVTVTPGSAAEMDVGDIELDYPNDAPYVYSLQYSYNKIANEMEADNTQNSVKIYDDTINITAVAVPNGHTIDRAEFVVRTMQGDETPYPVYADPGRPGIFTCSIPKMTENLFNGDRVTIRLVTKDGAGNEYYYPAVDSGLVFYVENTVKVPLTFDTSAIGTAQNSEINVPLLGETNAKAGTGLLSFSRMDWENNTGYTLSVNVDALLYNKSSLSTADKASAYDTLMNQAKTYQEMKEKQEIADRGTILYGQQLLKLGERYTGNAVNIFDDDDLDPDADGGLWDDSAEYGESDYDNDYNSIMSAIEASCNDYNEAQAAGNQAKNAVSSYKDINTLNVNLVVLMAFDFYLNPETNEYVFGSGAVSLGGTLEYDKAFYFVVYGIPMYLNLGGLVDASLTAYYPTGTLTAAEFEGVAGNIAERLEGSTVNMDFMLNLKAGVGVGMCGVLGAGGAVSLQFMYDIPILDPDNYGVAIAGSGGLFVDILVGRIDIPVITATKGWGTYDGMTDVRALGGIFDLLPSDSDSQTLRFSRAAGTNTVGLNVYDNGSADLSSFGSNGMLRAMPEEVQRTVLLDDAGERTAPQIISLDDGRKMLFFIHARDEENKLNSRALYWSVCDEDGSWSVPQLVADDGTFDAKPTVLQKNGKVVVAWVDADGSARDSDRVIEQLNSLGISMAIYENGVWSDEITLVQDEYFNFAPQLNLVGDTLYCSYMKRDIHDVTAVDGLLDFTNYYSTMAYVECDVPTRTAKEESYISIEHPTLDDPLVMDYQTAAVQVGGEDYLLSAYTVDGDGILADGSDRDLWLSITNLTTGKTYYPISITKDEVNQAAPKLTDLDGQVYLSWLENGCLFHMMNVNELLEAFFDTAEVGDVYRNASGENWYRKSAQDLGLASGEGSGDENDTAVYYDGTFYDLANQGIFRSEFTNFQASEEETASIADYTLATNGNDIYIFYTDFGSSDPSEVSVELYGVRYQRDMSDDGVDEDWGFGTAVMITDYDKVIDEFDLFMTADNKISMVSNHYKQWINDGGAVQKGANHLVEIEFEPRGSVSIVNNRVNLPAYLVGGSSEYIAFEVVNDGLLTTTAFDVTVFEVKNGAETEIFRDTIEAELDCGETYAVQVPWTIPEDLSNTEIKVVVDEQNVSIYNPSTETVKAPFISNFHVVSSAHWDGQGSYVTTELTNLGNKDAGVCTVRLYRLGDTTEDKDEVYTTMTLPALASGETAEMTIPFTPAVEDFGSSGIIDLMVMVTEDNAILGGGYTKLVPGKPMVAEINDGAEKLNLALGRKAELTVEAAPWSGIAGDVRYTSSDSSVADVSKNGTVTAVRRGTATITAYYGCGISDTIEVVVTQSASEDSGSDDSTPTYTATVDDTENGSVTVTPKSASKGDIVTVTVDPDDGYILETLAVTDKNGKELELSNQGNGKYTFKMPSGAVAVKATFMEDNTMLNYFVDVFATDYYYDAVLWAVEEGITSGTSATTFSPDASCTRGQMATFLWRAAGSPEPVSKTSPFVDVAADAYYAKAVQWAYEQGIAGGTSATTFSPDQTCTRGQMTTFLWRNAGSPAVVSSIEPFADIPTSAYYATAVQWAYEEEITSGTSATTFSPNNACTRAQMVTFLYRHFVK